METLGQMPQAKKFLTNEGTNTLRRRLEAILPSTDAFDCLVGYFFITGFCKIYQALEPVRKIRILIGLKNEQGLAALVDAGQAEGPTPSTAEMKALYARLLKREFTCAEEKAHVEAGVLKFIEWIRSGKLEVKIYREQNIHAKVYVMTPAQPVLNVNHGYVITGSSNFSHSGLEGSLEFNVLLGEPEDHDYALHRFNELWRDAVDIKDVHEVIVETVEKQSPYAQFTPYELYLKFLAEYFRDYLGERSALSAGNLPAGFKKLQYQEDAVFTAQQMLRTYGGVFLADVVGLGKTYMSALLALQLNGRCLVIAPPSLLDENSPGSWTRVFRDFCVPGHKCVSIGKLEEALEQGLEFYRYVIVDESHRFKGDSTQRYDLLTRICQNKGVILVSATPYNNTLNDIYSQLKLFQAPRNSTIPGVRNLEAFFYKLNKRLEGLDRLDDAAQYLQAVEKNSADLREHVLKYVMVRRTRREIEEFYAEDLKKQHVSFPKVADPAPMLYQLNKMESRVFQTTLERVTSVDFHYARYQPLAPEYYTGQLADNEVQGQRNLATFMKILLVKRLESSFRAFHETLARFIRSHELVLEAFDGGSVYTSKKHSYKVLDYLEHEDDEALEKLIEEEKAEKYEAARFTPLFRQHVQSDLKTLKAISKDWSAVTRDPKWLQFKARLKQRGEFTGKLIIFSEFADTAGYLAKRIKDEVERKTVLFTAGSSPGLRREMVLNFDANAPDPCDDYRILVSTDVLAEGVNLHRSATVINYDLPWNPSRLMQRVGRVNRVGTKFKSICIFNFFPTDEGNDQIALTESAKSKIQAFIKLLGNDARLLTGDENIESHGLFDRMCSKQWAEEDVEVKSELRYLRQILDLKDTNPKLYQRILDLPRKARSTRESQSPKLEAVALPGLLTYFRKARLDKFFVTGQQGNAREIDFFSAAEILLTNAEEQRQPIPLEAFYALLDRNKAGFDHATDATVADLPPLTATSGNEGIIAKRLRTRDIRTCPHFSSNDKRFVALFLQLVNDGRVAPAVLRKIKEALDKTADPLDVLGVLRKLVPKEYLQLSLPAIPAATDIGAPEKTGREVILSSYLP